MATMEDFVALKKINYICVALSQNRFVLSDSSIAVNLSKYEKVLCFLYKGKKASHGSFYKDEWFLDSDTFTHFTLFESDFINITLSNYSQVETINSKTPLFIVVSSTVLIEHEIFDPEKGTIKVAMSKLWLVYCIPSMQIHLLSTKQILQSRLRVEGNKSGSTFYDKFGNTILSANPNLWSNIQIIRTYILKHNVPNLVSLITRHLDFETLYHYFKHASDKIMYHIFDNVEDANKICFPTQKHVCHGYTLENMHQHSFSENLTCSIKSLELTYSDLLELLTLSCSKYKWIITFLDNYSSFYNIAFLHKKSEVANAIKSIFQMWSNTTSYPVKRLYTDNGGEYVTSEL